VICLCVKRGYKRFYEAYPTIHILVGGHTEDAEVRVQFRITIMLTLCILVIAMANSCLFGRCIKGTCSDGEGTYQYNNGDLSIGEWKNSKPNGHGNFYFANGDKYEGEWKNNKYNGRGTFMYSLAKAITGVWKDSEFLGE
jgi:hypothetical protein